MSIRKKIVQGAIGTAKKALEAARLKRKTYKPATHTTGPSGRRRKITGRHEKARAAAEAAAKSAKNAKTVTRVRAATAATGGVAGGTAAYAAGRRSGRNSNKNKPNASAPAAKPEAPKKKLPNPLSMKGRTGHNENSNIRSQNAAKAKKPETPTLKTAYDNMSPSARAALSARPKPVKKAAKKVAKKVTITGTRKLDPTRDGAFNKQTNVPKVKGRKPGQNKGKKKVNVGSEVIRNRDGSIKKVKSPSAKTLKLVKEREKAQKKIDKNPFAKMTKSQINRLSGKQAAAYRKSKKK